MKSLRVMVLVLSAALVTSNILLMKRSNACREYEKQCNKLIVIAEQSNQNAEYAYNISRMLTADLKESNDMIKHLTDRLNYTTGLNTKTNL